MKRSRLALPPALLIAAACAAAPTAAQDTPPPAVAGSAVSRVTITGARSVPEADLVGAALRAAANGTDSDAAIRAAAEAVVAEYKRRGFPVARVIATDLEADGTLRLTVAEGTIRSVVVRGNRKTRASTIRQTMETGPGDVYREEAVATDRDRLARLGIFEDVLVAPEPVEPGADLSTVGLVDLVVRVKERRTGNLAATLGYSDRTGVLGYIDLSENNFAGRAQRVSVQFQRVTLGRINDDDLFEEDKARSAFRASYFAPFIGRSRTAFGFEAYDQNTVFQPLFTGDNETLRTYERRKGFRVRAGRALGRGLSLFGSVRRDRIGYDPLPLRLGPPPPGVSDADGTVGALGLELISDARDAAENPRRGHLYSLAYENAAGLLGGNFRFGQIVVDARQYLPLSGGRNTPVLALRVLSGASTGTTPLPEQFWIGGYDLLRGYDLYSIRGERLFLASAEGRVPLGTATQGVLFVDIGDAWGPDTDFDLRSAIGLGLRFLSPIGPIRFDVAYGDGVKTYVSLGQAY